MNYSYSPDRLESLSRSISIGRLAPYLEAAEGQLEAAMRLYELNARLSAALYGPLQTLEVTVRNAMDLQLVDRFGEDWPQPGVVAFQKQQRDDIDSAVREVSVDDNGKAVDWTRNQLIAELNFGFWVGAIGPKNDVEIWRKAIWKAFPNRPKGTERKAVQGALNSVRRLRNRVAHHCRIIHRDLAADYATILDVIGWVCPVTREWTEAVSVFDVSEIPVPQQPLPIEGFPDTDPIPPATPIRPTLDGRPRLSLRDGDAQAA